MNGDFLLDTNIIIRLFARDQAVERQFDAESRILLPIFVLGELYYGALKSALIVENYQRIDDFLGHTEIIFADAGTAHEFGIIKTELERKGRMIPQNDLWIAAVARQHDLILISSDRHFAEVENLRWEQW